MKRWLFRSLAGGMMFGLALFASLITADTAEARGRVVVRRGFVAGPKTIVRPVRHVHVRRVAPVRRTVVVRPAARRFVIRPTCINTWRTHCRAIGYRGWSRFCYLPRHGRYGYFCPRANLWFAYVVEHRCYVPLNYLGTAATVGGPIVPALGNGPVGGLPPGATALPPGTMPPAP